LAGACAGEVFDFVGVDVEDDLSAAAVAVGDGDFGGVALVDLVAGEVADINGFAGLSFSCERACLE